MIKNISVFSFLLASIYLVQMGCSSSAKNNKTIEVESSILAEGPLFEGSNTAQAEVPIATLISEMLEDVKIEDLKDAKLTNCKLWIEPANDSAEVQNFDLLQSVSVSFAADELDMQAAGVLNPIEKAKKEIKINIAEEQENTLEFLKQKLFYIVADANLEQDLNDNLEIKCKLTFEVYY